MFNRKRFQDYLLGEALGRLVGFLAGMGTSYLIGKFFVRRSALNLWGIASRRTAVDKETLNWLELVVSILVGFVVLEGVTTLWEHLKLKELWHKGAARRVQNLPPTATQEERAQ